MAEAPFDPEKGARVGQRKPGAPKKLTDAARQVLIGLLRKGTWRKDACAYLGISTQTLANALKADPVFKVEVHRAELEGILAASECVTNAAAIDPKFALELLQRKRPHQWGKKRIKVEINPAAPKGGREVLDRLLSKLAGGVVEDDVPAKPATPEGDAKGE